MSVPTLITFILYILFMIGIGFWSYRRTSTIDDYILGGRSLNGWVTALSAQASDMSGWLLLGLPGYAYVAGLSSMWIAIGLAIGTYLNWQFIAKRLRRYTDVVNSITISDYFENRFKDNSHILRVISALLILIFFLFYTASGLVAGGKLFEGTFGLDYNVALYVGALVIISYTFLGGYLAVSWTDFFQGSLMFLALILVPLVTIFDLGGLNGLWNNLGAINPDLLDATKTVSYKFSEGVLWVTSNTSFDIVAVLSLMAWGLGYFGQPHILVRFMGIRSAKEIKKSRLIATVWVVLALWGALFVGYVGAAFHNAGIEGFENALSDPEQIFIQMVQIIFNPWISGFLLAAILAAVMSTIDSQLLVSSSALAEDFYKAIFRKNASQKELVWVSRGAVILISIIALILAKSGGSVLDLVAYAWAGFGAAFGPAIILSLFWKRTTRNGVLFGMIIGGLTVIAWKNYEAFGLSSLLPNFDFAAWYEIIPGFILSAITIFVVSLFDKEPSQDIVDEFERSKKPLVNE
ncbi:sodium/proline symporter [Vulcanibacillus modesticaldus]|uniref:Sodium/proline symporter n=2 Tax=Vulcanibacillus modesticaldus TaxID=337097 RepID=A0A1D2YTT8_9BACI|nr:sodium/proline symporter PutP [Vulcanibacillus modesticaldus]OEF99123.1 sodium/proline symporter [Vulcanibacillus modesticaldus]